MKKISNINTHLLDDIKYIVDDKVLLNMLNLLNIKYLNNFHDWTSISTSLKSCNKFNIRDECSKKGNKYNYNDNIELWNNNKGIIDINYLVSILNNTGHSNIKMFEKYKIFNLLTHNIKW